MKKIDLGQTISILANVGVIAGIVFLAIEISQNNQLLQAEAMNALLETRMTRTEEVARNENLAALIAKNGRNEELTDGDRIRLVAFHSRNFIGYQRDYFLFQQGILSEEFLRTNIPLMKVATSDSDSLSQSPYQSWEAFRRFAAPTYRVFVEECVLSDCATIPR